MSTNKIKERTALIKAYASELGFAHIGIARAEMMEPEAKRLEAWLNKGYQGKMAYLENHFDKRLDPTKLVPGAKSVVTLIRCQKNQQKKSIKNQSEIVSENIIIAN